MSTFCKQILEWIKSRIPTTTQTYIHKGGKGGAGGQILSSYYYVYKQLLQKDVQNIEKEERNKQLQVISSVTHRKIKA